MGAAGWVAAISHSSPSSGCQRQTLGANPEPPQCRHMTSHPIGAFQVRGHFHIRALFPGKDPGPAARRGRTTDILMGRPVSDRDPGPYSSGVVNGIIGGSE